MKLATAWLPRITVDLNPADCGMMIEAARCLVKQRSSDVAALGWPVGTPANAANAQALRDAISFERQVIQTLGGFIAEPDVKEGE